MKLYMKTATTIEGHIRFVTKAAEVTCFVKIFRDGRTNVF